MNDVSLLDALRAVVRGEVETDDDTLVRYSHDASIFELRPLAVAFPLDAEDLGRLVAFIAARRLAHPDERLSLTMRSAGTDMSGAAIGSSIIADVTRHMNTVRSVTTGSAVTQPGVFYRDFEKRTLEHGLLLPSFPASREICTVGGMVANDSGGEKSLRYGKTDRYVSGLKAVLRDGREYSFGPLDAAVLSGKLTASGVEGDIYRGMERLLRENAEVIAAARPHVSKNSAGYALWDVVHPDGRFDLARLLTGSQGTLAAITEIGFRLIRPEPRSRLLVIFLRDLARLPEIVQAVLAQGPESFESYDDHTLKVALRYFPDIMKSMGASNVFDLAWRFLPEALVIARHGMPRQFMIAEFTGMTDADASAKAEQARAAIAALGLPCRLTSGEQDSRKYWTVRRESFNLLRKHFKKVRTAPFIDDFCVPPSVLPEFFPRLQRIMDGYDLLFTLVGHVGDGNFHVIPLMDLSAPETPGIIRELSRKVYDLVLEYHGSITGEHNDGLVRGPYLRQMFGDKAFALMQETKRIWDPDGIFNPDKKVGATLEYGFAHLRKD